MNRLIIWREHGGDDELVGRAVQDKGVEEHPSPPPGQPGYRPPPGAATSEDSALRRLRMRDPLSMVLIAGDRHQFSRRRRARQ